MKVAIGVIVLLHIFGWGLVFSCLIAVHRAHAWHKGHNTEMLTDGNVTAYTINGNVLINQ